MKPFTFHKKKKISMTPKLEAKGVVTGGTVPCCDEATPTSLIRQHKRMAAGGQK
jgi:hypothetical protein